MAIDAIVGVLDLDEMEQESKEFHELLQRIFDASVLDSSS